MFSTILTYSGCLSRRRSRNCRKTSQKCLTRKKGMIPPFRSKCTRPHRISVIEVELFLVYFRAELCYKLAKKASDNEAQHDHTRKIIDKPPPIEASIFNEVCRRTSHRDVQRIHLIEASLNLSIVFKRYETVKHTSPCADKLYLWRIRVGCRVAGNLRTPCRRVFGKPARSCQ